MKLLRVAAFILVLSLMSFQPGNAQTNSTGSIEVEADQPGVAISSNLFGVFFEEISFAGEGGLYAEMVRNRTFGNSANPDFWTLATQGSATGQMSVDPSNPLNASLPRSLALTMQGGVGAVGVVNNGFWGMNLQSGMTYDLSFYVKGSSPFSGQINARLQSASTGTIYDQAVLGGVSTNWQRLATSFTVTASDTNAELWLSINQPGTVWIQVVSLFPHATFHNRTNGLRSDIANTIAALKPSFLRFPGGNYIEGDVLTNAFRWKNTIGDIATRPGHWNGAWGYYSTDGLGFHEFLQFCEDVGMEPLFDINCGLSLGWNGATNNTVPLDQMGPWVQDALDAIQYANGDTNTTWGALRAANGHPAPFNLKYMEIGNESGGSYYDDRYALFYDAIKSNYPSMHLIAPDWGGIPANRPVEIQDEHYYSDWTFFANNAHKYDSYSRTGPKVFVGEYAVTTGAGMGNLQGALGEAAFMTGLERNSDVVQMASYAPLLENVNFNNWQPDAIYYDNYRIAPAPSYYVQRMFSQNRGDYVLPATVAYNVITPEFQPRGAIGLGSWNTSVQYTNIVVTSNGVAIYQSDFVNQGTNGWRVYQGSWGTNAGLYQQTAIITDCRSTTGNTNWANYTMTLRARKVSGNEGFLIIFNWQDDNNLTWWNIGGWNNSLDAIEQTSNGTKSLISSQIPETITTGQWYDIKVVLNTNHIQCYLNNQLVQDVYYPNPNPTGAIGLGAWNTQNSFTNVVVTQNGQTLYQSDFAGGASEWQVINGSWNTNAGVYQQTAITTDCVSVTGQTNWSDYTLSLRARKDGGNEGFLIIFNWQDANNFTWWNIGGWNNTLDGIEQTVNGIKSLVGNQIPETITTGQWYDIKIVLSGQRIQCYLDGQLIHDVTYNSAPALLASASYAAASGQIIVKAVNTSTQPLTTQFALNTARGLVPTANATVLTSDNPVAGNTLDQPTNVVPYNAVIAGVSTNFQTVLPASSLTVFRFQEVPDAVVSLNLAATHQQAMSALNSGINVQLSSFTTNMMTVNFVVDAPSGVLANGKVQFQPGQTNQVIMPAIGNLTNYGIIRVTLDNPSNGQLGGESRAYYVQPLNGPNDPPRLAWAHFPDQTVVYWSDPTASLYESPAVDGTWILSANSNSGPVSVSFSNPQQYFRLER